MTESTKTILVAGATGNVGRSVVSQLLERGARVRALSRHADSAGLPPEAEVVTGDLESTGDYDRFLEGADAVFLVWRLGTAELAPAFAQAVARRARRLVLLSSSAVQDGVERQPDPLGQMHADLERAVAESGVAWTVLRPGAFATNTRFWLPQIKTGDVVRWPYAEAQMNPIHEADIAAVGVRALLDDGHEGKTYVLTGPESLTQAEEVRAIGEATGRDLRFEEISPDEARAALGAFMPPPIVDTLLRTWAALVGNPAPVTNTVEEVTGSPARAFRRWAEDHAAEFRKDAAPQNLER